MNQNIGVTSGGNTRATVRSGYDAIAERYHRGRVDREGVNIKWLDSLRQFLPDAGKVVDLGCGSGVPISRYFANRGYEVTGFDLSPAMVELARIEVPQGTFKVGAIEDIQVEPESIDLVLSFFAIIHIPRELHPKVYANIYLWLKPGGAALLSLGANDNPNQTEECWYGARMKWSHFDDETKLNLLRQVGLEVAWSEVGGPAGEQHLFVVARTP